MFKKFLTYALIASLGAGTAGGVNWFRNQNNDSTISEAIKEFADKEMEVSVFTKDGVSVVEMEGNEIIVETRRDTTTTKVSVDDFQIDGSENVIVIEDKVAKAFREDENCLDEKTMKEPVLLLVQDLDGKTLLIYSANKVEWKEEPGLFKTFRASLTRGEGEKAETAEILVVGGNFTTFSVAAAE